MLKIKSQRVKKRFMIAKIESIYFNIKKVYLKILQNIIFTWLIKQAPLHLYFQSMQSPDSFYPLHSSQIQSQNSYNLLEQHASQMTHTIQIKQKKINYLQSQLKTIKQEYSARLELVQKAYNQLKRQYQALQKRYLQQKHLDSMQRQDKIKKINEDHRLSFLEKDKAYQKMFNDQQERFENTLKTVETRYQSIINKLKQESKYFQGILFSKEPKNEVQTFSQTLQIGKQFTFGTEEYRYLSLSPNLINVAKKELNQATVSSTLLKQKTSLLQQLFSLKEKFEKLLKQLQTQRKINIQMQNDHRLAKIQLEGDIAMARKEADTLNQKIQNILEEKQGQKKLFMNKILDLQRRNQRIHSHMKQIEETYLLTLANRARQQKPSPVTAIKSCNHSGLIAQLQTNIQIKDEEIQKLKQKVLNLQKLLGLDKNIPQRLHQVGNISERTLQLHKSQKQKIFNKTMKIGKR